MLTNTTGYACGSKKLPALHIKALAICQFFNTGIAERAVRYQASFTKNLSFIQRNGIVTVGFSERDAYDFGFGGGNIFPHKVGADG